MAASDACAHHDWEWQIENPACEALRAQIPEAWRFESGFLFSETVAATAGGLSISTDGGTSFTNRTTTEGLGDDAVYGVFVSGSTVYAATNGGLSISTNGGTSFANRTTAEGLGDNSVRGVFAVPG